MSTTAGSARRCAGGGGLQRATVVCRGDWSGRGEGAAGLHSLLHPQETDDTLYCRRVCEAVGKPLCQSAADRPRRLFTSEAPPGGGEGG